MLDVFFTVDVEIWCGDQPDSDRNFLKIFEKYVYGSTPKGNFGLPFQVNELSEHGLKGVFFVEPLFSTRYGIDPLKEIIDIIKSKSQEVQLHLHPEWVCESKVPLFENARVKRQHLREFSLEEQTILVREGNRLLGIAGASGVNAFRAGSFAFNANTLAAIAANGIFIDSSYNESLFGKESMIVPGVELVEPIQLGNVVEYPMTVFHDGTGKLRHAQLTACSFEELEGLMWQALEEKRQAFVILSHNFELLNPAKNRADDVVITRFRKLCAFLDMNRDSFNTRGFMDLIPSANLCQPPALTSPVWRTGHRMLEQVFRRKYL